MTIKIKNLTFNKLLIERVHGFSEETFMKILKPIYPQARYIETSDNRILIFVDRDSPVLGVAHLDGTMPPTHFAFGRHYAKPMDIAIFSPFVDDRLGAYTLIDLLPQINADCDLLFTVGEETGNTTAKEFTSQKDYNWMFQFDRMGTDVVRYRYRKPEWIAAITEKFGEPPEVGMFSDIDYMEKLGCQGMNIGTGYYDYTTKAGWASLNELTDQVNKFASFYHAYKDIPFHHPKDEPQTRYDGEQARNFFGKWTRKAQRRGAHRLRINVNK
jgi:hypothetical protein